MADTSAMTLIETKTLVSAAASIEFTSIPQDGTDLYILASLRDNQNQESADITFTFNGSATGYSGRQLFGLGSGGGGSASAFSSTKGYALRSSSNTSTSNTFGSSVLYIPNYSGSTNKSFSIDGVSENNATFAIQELWAGLWSNTAGITSILFSANSPALLQIGSTISLYKITKGSDGIVTTS